MTEFQKTFPEMGLSTDPKQVPWADAVVWSDTWTEGKRVYEWLTKEHMRSVSWERGQVSIELAMTSFLAKHMMYFLIRAPFMVIGRNVPFG
jgi:hypothetical protein